jgi:hypothetical protein
MREIEAAEENSVLSSSFLLEAVKGEKNAKSISHFHSLEVKFYLDLCFHCMLILRHLVIIFRLLWAEPWWINRATSKLRHPTSVRFGPSAAM